MKREFTAHIFVLITALILVLSVALPSGILPDKCGNSLLLQAARFERGEITAPPADTSEKNEQFYKIYTAGYMLGAVEKLFSDGTAWKITALLCVLFSAHLIFLTLSSFSPKKKAFFVLCVFFAFPSLALAYFSASGYIGTMLFMSLFMFVMFIKTDYFLKWYLASLISAFMFVDLPFLCIVFYAVPIAAYLDARKYQSSAKAFALASGVLVFGIAMHIFCSFMYKDALGAFDNFAPQNILNALKSETTFFFALSFIGIFKCPKYVKRYIVPSLCAYPVFLLASAFSQNIPALELCFLPLIFTGFSASIIHQKFYRKYSRITLFIFVIAVVVMSVQNISAVIALAKTLS
ncbi:hypothetical protein [Qingrenia yutianensis]|uniref:Uncharacterized protein n=1 Tax=Qingrenia yutianensis TaxID=2763676 RepID=A0A926F5W7_9FIRM|nr:hypothetical protein [Qingrenia yutianensis]MBC8596343.1 hypothetical protein [Qingrenia yutianensis]